MLERLLEACGDLGIAVRCEPLGGEGGGLCLLRGQRVLFVDSDADLAFQLDTTASALADLPELGQMYLPPVLRETLDAKRATDSRSGRDP